MIRLSVLVLSLAVPVLISPRAEAQLPDAGGSLIVGVPQGDFGRHLTSPAFGVGGFVVQKLPGLPLRLGMDGALLIYGLDARDGAYEIEFGHDVDAFTTNSLAMGHLLLRLQDAEHAISPYADLLVGAKYFFTETRIDGERWGYWGDPLGKTLSFDDVAFSYGMGGGLRMHWISGSLGEDGPNGTITLHLGVRYLFGSRATYLKRGAAYVRDGEIAYESERSRTDMVVPQFGVSFSVW